MKIKYYILPLMVVSTIANAQSNGLDKGEVITSIKNTTWNIKGHEINTGSISSNDNAISINGVIKFSDNFSPDGLGSYNISLGIDSKKLLFQAPDKVKSSSFMHNGNYPMVVSQDGSIRAPIWSRFGTLHCKLTSKTEGYCTLIGSSTEGFYYATEMSIKKATSKTR